MRISAKLSVALFGIFLALLAGAACVLALAFSPAFSGLESRLHERDVARVEARLESLRGEVLARVRDYAEWDDTRAFIVGRYPRFIADNFTADWLANYDIDLALITNDRGTVLWQTGHNQLGQVIDTFDVSGFTGQIRRRLSQSAGPVSGVIWTELGPMMFAAMPSTGTSATAPPRGIVMFARRLTGAALAEQVQLDVSLFEARRAPLALAARLLGQDFSPWTNEGHIASLIPLRNAQGEVVGGVLTSSARDIVALGQRVIAVALGLFAVLAAIACAALWLLMRRLVVSPLASLEQAFERQSHDADIAPVADAHASDEIGGVKRAYNQLVSRVRESRGEAEEAQRERATAEAANQMKSQFLANMSHELRTPLNAIIGYVELTLEQLDEMPTDVTRGDLEKVITAARHQLRLINEVLDLARIEAGGVTLEIDQFDGALLIEETVRIVQPLAMANKNQLHIEIDGELGVLRSDAFRLKQCLINVVGNACKFTHDGVVAISARKAREGGLDMLEVKVADTGIGMTPEQLSLLFEPFVQADVSITRRYGGSGLGLSITRNVVQLLGGRIESESVLGQGSTFTLTVPVGHTAEEDGPSGSPSFAEVA